MTRHRSGGPAGDRWLQGVGLVVLMAALAGLGLLLVDVIGAGRSRLSWAFLASYPSRHAEQAGVLPALVGSVWLIALTAIIAVPLGVAAAIHLEEYGGGSRLERLIEINIANLAGVPSIIYGVLGLGLFVRTLAMGRSVLAGAATLALLVLPVVILSTREALRAVPPSLREGSYALGASRWQTTWHQVLPAAMPGILTGLILALSRALGEAAPLVVLGAVTYVSFLPDGVTSPFMALPVQIFHWVSRPQAGFRETAAAGAVVLLAVLLAVNGAAILLRDRLRQRSRLS